MKRVLLVLTVAATLTLNLASAISANTNHQIYFGPDQANDAFIALDWAELHNTGVTPSPPDADGDGVPDSNDACGTVSGPASNNGCPVEEPPPPPTDTDGDGIGDATDQCDPQAGPASNNGCPLPQSDDYDRDGIPNAQDPISGLEEHQNIAGSPRI